MKTALRLHLVNPAIGRPDVERSRDVEENPHGGSDFRDLYLAEISRDIVDDAAGGGGYHIGETDFLILRDKL